MCVCGWRHASRFQETPASRLGAKPNEYARLISDDIDKFTSQCLQTYDQDSSKHRVATVTEAPAAALAMDDMLRLAMDDPTHGLDGDEMGIVDRAWIAGELLVVSLSKF